MRSITGSVFKNMVMFLHLAVNGTATAAESKHKETTARPNVLGPTKFTCIAVMDSLVVVCVHSREVLLVAGGD